MNFYQQALAIISHKGMSKMQKLKKIDYLCYKPMTDAIKNATPAELSSPDAQDLMREIFLIDELITSKATWRKK